VHDVVDGQVRDPVQWLGEEQYLQHRRSSGHSTGRPSRPGA
jgi:hypothetical protein